MDDTARTTVPWQFRAVSLLGLLWNGFGGYDYTMTRLGNMDYLSAAAGSPEAANAMLDSIAAMPVWASAAWAIGIWASVLGAVLLVVRSRHAAGAFLLSLAGAAVSFGYQLTHPMPGMSGPASLIIPVVIMGLIVFFWWYARRAAAKGLMR